MQGTEVRKAMADLNALFDAMTRRKKFQSGTPATDERIAEMEKALGVKFDPGYRAFLRRFGFAIWFGDSIFGYFELDEEKWPGYDFDAVRRTKEVRNEPVPKGYKPFPKDAVVIGDDQAGGYFGLRSLASKPPGEVVWFQYEDDAPSFERWPTFAAYVKSLLAKGR
jgi:hypothetical protein